MVVRKPTSISIFAPKKGFYALVDAILDSDEYSEAFGERRFPTALLDSPVKPCVALRVGSIGNTGTQPEKVETPRFVQLGTTQEEPD